MLAGRHSRVTGVLAMLIMSASGCGGTLATPGPIDAPAGALHVTKVDAPRDTVNARRGQTQNPETLKKGDDARDMGRGRGGAPRQGPGPGTGDRHRDGGRHGGGDGGRHGGGDGGRHGGGDGGRHGGPGPGGIYPGYGPGGYYRGGYLPPYYGGGYYGPGYGPGVDMCPGSYPNPAYDRSQVAEENAEAFRLVGESAWLPKCVSAPNIVEENATSFRRVGSAVWERK